MSLFPPQHLPNDGYVNTAPISGTVHSITFPLSVNAGSLLVLGSSSTDRIGSVADSIGNMWVRAISYNPGISPAIEIWSAYAWTGGPNTVTVTYLISQTVSLHVMEFSGGQAPSEGADSSAFATSVTTPGTALNSGSGSTTTAPSEILIGLGGVATSPNGFVAGTGYTLSTALPAIPGAGDNSAMEWQIVSAIGTYSATLTATTSTDWNMIFASLIAPGGPAPGLVAQAWM